MNDKDSVLNKEDRLRLIKLGVGHSILGHDIESLMEKVPSDNSSLN